MTPDEREKQLYSLKGKIAPRMPEPSRRLEKQEQSRKIRLAERYQLKILCPLCLEPCELVGYDAKGEGGRWQCYNREHWD